jgi:hypothetical protein
MKTRESISGRLGITQEEISLLLGIHRSQWSMFQSGKRDLPTNAKLLLAEMLAHMEKAEAAAKKESQKPADDAAHKKHLEKLLRENEFKRVVLEKKIDALERKQLAHERRRRLAEFFAGRDAEAGKMGALPRFHFGTGANVQDANRMALLVRHAVKNDLLLLEKQFLEERIKNLTKPA